MRKNAVNSNESSLKKITLDWNGSFAQKFITLKRKCCELLMKEENPKLKTC